MNEDEAFIRAIVDTRDETARMVYADWLDDRDDPRGPYLRAEMEWAKPWRNGERPEDAPAVRGRAAGLDPVWVARISRPPIGACCEHICFVERGPQITSTDIDAAERELGLVLPAEYRAFLLNYNGGRPAPVAPTDRTGEDEVGHPVEWFDPLATVAAPANHPLRHWLDLPEHPRLRRCIPIGTTGSDNDAVYLRSGGERAGRVYVWRECNRGDLDPDLVQRLATSFAVLMSRLRIRQRH